MIVDVNMCRVEGNWAFIIHCGHSNCAGGELGSAIEGTIAGVAYPLSPALAPSRVYLSLP